MNNKYIAPESNVMEMKAEGVLCGSDFTFNAPGKPENQGASIQIWQNQEVTW